jgi:DNA-binding transcriptional LysR family regulator
MDLRQLRTFVAIAEQGTVSKAALLLRTAQPALSRQIRDLEDELGVKLFDRIRRRLVMTVEGEQLLGDCRTVLGAAGTLVEHARALRRGEHGILRVAATPQTIEGVLSTFLPRYARLRPSVEIRLSEAVGAHLLVMLERGEVHMVLALAGLLDATRGNHEAIERFDLAPVEFLAAFPASLKLAAGATVEIGELASHPLLLLDSSFYVRHTFDAACRLAGVKPTVFLESRAPHALLALAEAGHGVAIVPSVQPTNRYRLRVARIAHRGRALSEMLTVLSDRRRGLPAHAKDFCDALASHVRKYPLTKVQRGREVRV